VFIVVSVNFLIDSVRKLLDTPSYARKFPNLAIRQTSRFWSSQSFMSKGYQWLLSRGKSDQSVKLIAHLHLLPRS